MPLAVVHSSDLKPKKLTMFKEGNIYCDVPLYGDKGFLPISGGVYTMGEGVLDIVYGWDEIGFITAGTMEVEHVDTGKTYTCSTGDLIFASKGEHVIIKCESTATCIFVSYPTWDEATKGTPMEGFFG